MTQSNVVGIGGEGNRQRIVYVTVCPNCGGKTWSGTERADERRPVGALGWQLPAKAAEKLRWCDCEAQAQEVDMQEGANE